MVEREKSPEVNEHVVKDIAPWEREFFKEVSFKELVTMLPSAVICGITVLYYLLRDTLEETMKGKNPKNHATKP